jgi:hypothetical protein
MVGDKGTSKQHELTMRRVDYKFKDIIEAYDTFTRGVETGALKMNIEIE